MEFLNKVEIKGVVGRINPTKYHYNFSVITECDSNNGEGSVIEITWFSAIAWSDQTPAVVSMKKGDKVHLIGRLRQRRYTDQEGKERYFAEVVVQSLEILED